VHSRWRGGDPRVLGGSVAGSAEAVRAGGSPPGWWRRWRPVRARSRSWCHCRARGAAADGRLPRSAFLKRTESTAAYLCRAVLVKPPEGVEVVEVGRVRAGAQAYLGPRPGVGSPAGDMMVDGVLFPLGEALRPLGLWRPSTRTWRQQHAGSRPRCIGDIQALRAREVSRRRERLVSEFSKCVVAAFEQLASKRQARAVTAEPLGGLPVVVAVRRPWTPGGLGGLV
jgi:hypothetical protein